MILSGVTWSCPHCQWTNGGFREICRNCGYDSNAGEFPYYNPLPPYEGSEAARKEWEAKEKALLELVNQQAEDEGLWFDATKAPEAYLQQELRKLHVAIEGKSIGEAILNREQEKL